MTERPTLHHGQPILSAGVPLAEARAALVLIHGRGATAESILALGQELDTPGFVYLAPQAANFAWYPERFIAPVQRNEPWLSSALHLLDDLLEHLAGAGIPAERTVLLGFSQGGCLALEYGARRSRRYGGLVALSGALIENGDQPRAYAGSLAGTPAFLGCSDSDMHIPVERVRRSTRLLADLGAAVTERIYPRMGHTVNEDEITAVRELLAGVGP